MKNQEIQSGKSMIFGKLGYSDTTEVEHHLPNQWPLGVTALVSATGVGKSTLMDTTLGVPKEAFLSWGDNDFGCLPSWVEPGPLIGKILDKNMDCVMDSFTNFLFAGGGNAMQMGLSTGGLILMSDLSGLVIDRRLILICNVLSYSGNMSDIVHLVGAKATNIAVVESRDTILISGKGAPFGLELRDRTWLRVNFTANSVTPVPNPWEVGNEKESSQRFGNLKYKTWTISTSPSFLREEEDDRDTLKLKKAKTSSHVNYDNLDKIFSRS